MKSDIIIPGVIIIFVIVSGYYFITEWQQEQILTEDEAIDKMVLNIKNLKSDDTDCQELLISIDNSYSRLIQDALKEKYMEMNC